MYEKKLQLDLDDFIFSIVTLDPENAWVKLAKMMPWEKIEKKYAENFKNNGHFAFNAWVALGALLIIAPPIKHTVKTVLLITLILKHITKLAVSPLIWYTVLFAPAFAYLCRIKK